MSQEKVLGNQQGTETSERDSVVFQEPSVSRVVHVYHLDRPEVVSPGIVSSVCKDNPALIAVTILSPALLVDNSLLFEQGLRKDTELNRMGLLNPGSTIKNICLDEVIKGGFVTGEITYPDSYPEFILDESFNSAYVSPDCKLVWMYPPHNKNVVKIDRKAKSNIILPDYPGRIGN